MSRAHPGQWLVQRSRTGLQEMPSNAAWLLARVLKPAKRAGPATGSAIADTRDRAWKVRAAVTDAAPIGGDSVDTRLKRAKAAAERAQAAENEALAAAQESKQRSDHAKQVSERARAHRSRQAADVPGRRPARRRSPPRRRRAGRARAVGRARRGR